MEKINTVLGIVASLLSIGAIFYSQVTSNRTKKIEEIISEKMDIKIGSSNNEKNTVKKAVSGDNGNSVIGDNNTISGDK
ncbi:hypothetical protein [Enterococcus hirae]|uniref:hypothetical protein n=1 Tax=Enterococcus hirae TaxID=1354 RepID=UPI0039A43555